MEVPINAEFVEGSSVYKGQKAYTREEALKHFREAAAAAGKPFIYLSAGVSNAQFTESLAMASEAGTDYSGVLCGRATWKDGIPIYGKQGLKALEEWLQREGVRNINAVNAAIQSAKPWYANSEFRWTRSASDLAQVQGRQSEHHEAAQEQHQHQSAERLHAHVAVLEFAEHQNAPERRKHRSALRQQVTRQDRSLHPFGHRACHHERQNSGAPDHAAAHAEADAA